MPDEQRGNVTEILETVREPEELRARLLPLVYEQLRSIAQRRMRSERPDHTLQATALVHEAYIRLLGDVEIDWKDRGHFYAVAADAMRRILIDHARKRESAKRGGGWNKAPIRTLDLTENAEPHQILALNDVLTRLESEDPRAARVVKLRFFTGLDVGDTAKVLDTSRRTVIRDWTFARTRMFQMLREADG